jgi:hypothetical protein
MSGLVYFSNDVQMVLRQQPQLRPVLTAVVNAIDQSAPPAGWQEYVPGQMWVHDDAQMVITRVDHLPVLLVTEVCATCHTRHLDAMHEYNVMGMHEVQPEVPDAVSP